MAEQHPHLRIAELPGNGKATGDRRGVGVPAAKIIPLGCLDGHPSMSSPLTGSRVACWSAHYHQHSATGRGSPPRPSLRPAVGGKGRRKGPPIIGEGQRAARSTYARREANARANHPDRTTLRGLDRARISSGLGMHAHALPLAGSRWEGGMSCRKSQGSLPYPGRTTGHRHTSSCACPCTYIHTHARILVHAHLRPPSSAMPSSRVRRGADRPQHVASTEGRPRGGAS
ncbi:hypothetical protein H696_03426 [Fonticula alba]|uniref:Uncharacterized protein n=1 Tax=Fonticula alba TaxID=691883 RepID=A0A058Z7B0_FONAL|nr:hypothetical protein H696_03426 [Fonticula alba]KCV69961.1 hypothetical protein H696_03426 [Fonticula alba]|eukprot:XP_009495567.1 hypothetical protein H696_03426 [Fonticula alba]